MTKIRLIIYSTCLLIFTMNSCDNKGDVEPEIKSDPIINIEDVIKKEGNEMSNISVRVSLSHATDKEVSIAYNTMDSTAEMDKDYRFISGILNFTPNEIQKSIEIQSIADTLKEETELFIVNFTNPVNATLSKNRIFITIEDDDVNTLDTMVTVADTIFTYAGYTTPLVYEGYHLAWSDEFQGEILNEENWTYVIGDGCPNLCGWGNNELEYYRSENSKVEKDLLTITAKREDYGSRAYTSSRIKSIHKKYFRFGRIDIRAKLPYGQGLWPALWMMGNNLEEVGWPACGEIDIMELRGEKPHIVCNTVHYKNSSGVHQYDQPECRAISEGDFSDEFHVFSIVWDDEQILFYIDDKKMNTVRYTSLNLAEGVNPFLKEFFFLMNVAVGGNYVMNPDQNTTFPQTMEVDYVRVFQKN